jgi:uncharacterized membrane protein YfhO
MTRLTAPAFDPRSGTALVIGAPPTPRPDRDLTASDRATVIRAESDRVEVEVALAGAALLVLRDAHYPGWRARVGPDEREIFAAFGGLRAVALPPGTHRVVFTYEPLSLRLGALVSGVSLLILLWLGARPWFRRRRTTGSNLPPREKS